MTVCQRLMVIDFTDIPTGTLVKRSEHFLKDRCIGPRHKERRAIGIITGKKFYQDVITVNGVSVKRGITCWPMIHWEGSCTDSSCHPILVQLYRKSQADYVRMKVMEEG